MFYDVAFVPVNEFTLLRTRFEKAFLTNKDFKYRKVIFYDFLVQGAAIHQRQIFSNGSFQERLS